MFDRLSIPLERPANAIARSQNHGLFFDAGIPQPETEHSRSATPNHDATRLHQSL